MPAAEAYLKRRRNVLPVIYFPRRKYAQKCIRQVVQAARPNSSSNDAPQMNEIDEIPNMLENNDVPMVGVEQIAVEVDQCDEIQFVPENPDIRVAQAARFQLREAELQDTLDHTKKVVAKREEELQRRERVIQNLHSLLGVVDLTEESLNIYDDILMSIENDQNAGSDSIEIIDDPSDESGDEFTSNKENERPVVLAPQSQVNGENNIQTDMMFSFQHGFVENVNKFIHLFMVWS